VMLTLARLEKDRGDLTRSLALVQQSVEIIEHLRTSVVSQDLRASFLASKQAHYELQIDILMALHESQPDKGHAAEALRVSEQARARSLLEILQEGGADIRQGAPPDLLERERLLRAEVGERELQRLKVRSDQEATPERLDEAQKRLDESLEAYREIQERLLESSPRYAALTQPRPLEVAKIQAGVLDGGALLLEYALGTERSYLWAVTPASVESFPLPARDRIEGLASRYYGLLTARNQPDKTRERLTRMDTETEQVSAELSAMLLGPVRHLLKDQPLLVVSDGALQYIPFSALPVPGTTTLLIQKHAVVNLPSASALAVLREEILNRPAAPLTLAVLADPVFQKDDDRLARLPRPGDVADRSSTSRGMKTGLGAERESEADLESFLRLWHSAREADEIVSLLPADQTFRAVGFDASRATALSGRLAEYRNVHFATHGLVRSDHPGLSSLVLSLYEEKGEPVDGFLRLNDIYNLELRADLVVLSACRTALGKEIRGEGLIGLTRGFMYAGASRVLATLWSVDDRATADFMKHFYRAMLNGKLSPAEAVRQAQLVMMARPNRKAPYFWAGFSLQGEWK
ncbi:CHAT domain-containing protein, partial [bacterium]